MPVAAVGVPWFPPFHRHVSAPPTPYLAVIVLLGTSHLGLYWIEISDSLAEQGAIKIMSEISYNNLLLSSQEIASVLEKTVFKELEKSV